jgi:uncharacterized membrane-anchored protein
MTTREMLNKVPEVTLYFWIIKILCTTVGETAADFLNSTLNLGLNGTSIVMAVILIIVLIFQFRTGKYVPFIYWLSVVLLSIVGTLITDTLIDNFGISLQTTTVTFAISLAIVFAVWFVSEKTLSIHSIVTTRRETFYWLAILFTFALGTAAGDLVAEQFDIGYLNSIFLFAGAIALITVLYYGLRSLIGRERHQITAYSILAFWLAYILTRPLGASIGDFLSQTADNGGLGLGTTLTSAIFLVTILALVIYLTRSKKDLIIAPQENVAPQVK